MGKGKKNLQRAHNIVQEYEVSQNVGDLVGYTQLQNNRLRGHIAVELDKAEARGRRKGHLKLREENRVWREQIDDMEGEIDDLREANECHRKARAELLAPQYIVEQAEVYADDLVDAAYRVADCMTIENSDDLKKARQDVIDAITSSAKPAPQFDAEKVNRLLVILDANGDRFLTVDVGDFISDNPIYEEKHAENATAKALADLIVQAPRLLEACTKARNVLVEIRKRI